MKRERKSKCVKYMYKKRRKAETLEKIYNKVHIYIYWGIAPRTLSSVAFIHTHTHIYIANYQLIYSFLGSFLGKFLWLKIAMRSEMHCWRIQYMLKQYHSMKINMVEGWTVVQGKNRIFYLTLVTRHRSAFTFSDISAHVMKNYLRNQWISVHLCL